MHLAQILLWLNLPDILNISKEVRKHNLWHIVYSTKREVCWLPRVTAIQRQCLVTMVT